MPRFLFIAFVALIICDSYARDPSKVLEPDRSATLAGRQSSAYSVGLPIYKRWHQMTADEKAPLLAQYELMPEGDEPPYPKRGLAPIMQELVRDQQQLRVEGELFVVVDVDHNGVALGVKAYGSLSPETVQAAARALMREEYKPAVCAGRPCTMEFPFRIVFSIR